jgi:hypothetical protein
MKKIREIRKMVNVLIKRLNGQKVVENFGEKEIHILEQFIGDIWEYPYDARMEIISLTNEFASWCSNYTGKQND